MVARAEGEGVAPLPHVPDDSGPVEAREDVEPCRLGVAPEGELAVGVQKDRVAVAAELLSRSLDAEPLGLLEGCGLRLTPLRDEAGDPPVERGVPPPLGLLDEGHPDEVPGSLGHPGIGMGP